MLETIKDPGNVDSLNLTATALTEIFNLWFELMKVMKSVRAQSEETIKTFEANTVALNAAVRRLLTAPPVPGCALKPSKQLKGHLLFDGEIVDWLKVWKTLGCMDEQNIEGVHPEFNHLFRRFGNSRGAFQKAKIVREFLFARASWIVESIDSMKEETGRKRKGADEETANGDATTVDAVRDLIEGNADDDGEGDARADGGGEDAVPEEEEVGTGELSALDLRISTNAALHPRPGFAVCACLA